MIEFTQDQIRMMICAIQWEDGDFERVLGCPHIDIIKQDAILRLYIEAMENVQALKKAAESHLEDLVQYD